jgi:hypothetical protein
MADELIFNTVKLPGGPIIIASLKVIVPLIAVQS